MIQKKNVLLAILIFLAYGSLISQNQDSIVEFKPNGKPEGRLFTDFYYEFNENKTAFEVTRAYLGYMYNFSETFSARVTFDVSKPDVTINGKPVDTLGTSLQSTAHLKYAYATYQKDKFSVSLGMIELNQFKLQDQHWGHRYIMKTIQDEHGYTPGADIGLKADYKLADWIRADICIRNGEGFKKVQSDKTYWCGIGIILQPVKQFFYHAFFDYSQKDLGQSNFSSYIGYVGEKFKIGGEFVLGNNVAYTEDKELSSYSVFSAVQISPKFEIFARYDNLSSNTLSDGENGWNYNNDKNFALGGIQFVPVKNVSMALNCRYTLPDDSEKTEKFAVYMNFDFKF